MQYFECYGRFHLGWYHPYAAHPRVYSKLFKIYSGAFVRNHGPPFKYAFSIPNHFNPVFKTLSLL